MKYKPKGSAVSNHLLLCSYSPYFENFRVVTKENRKFVLEFKETLLIMRDKLSFNRNIRSAPLYLFDKAKLRLTRLFGDSQLSDSSNSILNC